MSDRSGAALLRDVLTNIDRSTLDKKAKRVAAVAAWKAGAGHDFTGWDVLDGEEDLGERLGLTRFKLGDGGEPDAEIRAMATGDWRWR